MKSVRLSVSSDGNWKAVSHQMVQRRQQIKCMLNVIHVNKTSFAYSNVDVCGRTEVAPRQNQWATTTDLIVSDQAAISAPLLS